MTFLNKLKYMVLFLGLFFPFNSNAQIIDFKNEIAVHVGKTSLFATTLNNDFSLHPDLLIKPIVGYSYSIQFKQSLSKSIGIGIVYSQQLYSGWEHDLPMSSIQIERSSFNQISPFLYKRYAKFRCCKNSVSFESVIKLGMGITFSNLEGSYIVDNTIADIDLLDNSFAVELNKPLPNLFASNEFRINFKQRYLFITEIGISSTYIGHEEFSQNNLNNLYVNFGIGFLLNPDLYLHQYE